ncbi:MAG: DNA polymerase I [Candidatus Latescibacteria bacterium]|nr:DNA polymerase I [Candidatus Latescibacterota bacterium]NIM20954.1 DNA polymerase I [Candidatus Latescibacterota bacterium]NIM65089.1 DNA polymerase I [Candidatus Latescibacterota bacterium]NIO01604.1 DNA polymerase I [Candidatus Latescibacterota bacterium]NIO28121.1 DNA polymerase I [Candidatus Latescibacterota bacterium]
MALYLIDGHALAYRAYYAFIRNPLVTSKGEETSAVFGFANTVVSLLKKFDPSHIAAVFDSIEKTHRHEFYPEYKAHRERMPDSLIGQIPRIQELLEAMSIPIFLVPGYEADDLLATIATALESKIPVRIVSGDKDLFQIVTERTHIIRPGKGGLLEDEIDPERLEQKIGLRPGEMVDFLALTGDASDNIPGVAGVGEKTARKLIKKYGTLDGIYENIDEIGPDSLKKKLARDRENAFLSRDLVVLDRSVPFDFSIEDMKHTGFRTESLQAVLRDLELVRLAEEVKGLGNSGGSFGAGADSGGGDIGDADLEGKKQYILVDSESLLSDLAGALQAVDEFALDVESSRLDPMRAELAGISFSIKPGRAWYVPVKSRMMEEELALAPAHEAPGLPLDLVRARLGPILSDPAKKKIGQNIKYDAIVLRQAGFDLRGVYFDTMIASYCLHPARQSHSLDNLSKEIFGHEKISFKSLFDTRTRVKDIRKVPVERVKEYACEDADFTMRLKHEFEPMIEASQIAQLFWEVEMPLCSVLTEMEIQGVRLDTDMMRMLSDRISNNLSHLEKSIYEAAGERFNINSTSRLQAILFSKLKLKPLHKTKTGYSTDVEVLKALSAEHELPRLVLEYRSLDKLKSTYIDALPKLVNPQTGRVHTSYNQAVTSTGRLSSSDPNLQNIPIRTELGREIRKGFVSSGPDWVLLDADYSQVELRVLAHLSKDIELRRAFEEGADVHRKTAARILKVPPEQVSEEMRSRAKAVNFGVVYGMGPRGLAQALDIDFKEAKQFIEDYFENYPGVKRFIDDTIEGARRNGAVSTLLGRVRQLPGITSNEGRVKSFAERIAVNTPVQGTAADIIKVAMVQIARKLKEGGFEAKMILQVHDELLFDLPEEELKSVREIVEDTMENAIKLDVPLKIDMGVGKNWLEAHA